MTIEEMKRIKQEKGYTYEYISKRSGVPLGTVQKIFSGETQTPRYDTKQALESVFDEPLMVRESVVDIYGHKGHTQGNYTVEDYFALPEERRVELIDGRFYDMAAPTYTHQYALGEVYYQIADFIKKRGGKCVPLFSPIDVQLDRDERTMIQPDVIVVCNREDKLKGGRIFGAPDFVLEVVSPSSRRRDYLKKLGKYSNAGVREYWLLDPEVEKLITYHFESGEGPTIYGLDKPVPMRLFDGELMIDLTAIEQWIREMEED